MLKSSFGLKAVVQKNDAFIKIHAEIEKKNDVHKKYTEIRN